MVMELESSGHPSIDSYDAAEREDDEAGPLLNTSYAHQQSRLSEVGQDESPGSFDKAELYFMVVHFLLAFCTIILVAPLIRLFENSLCLRHYQFPIGGVDESLCKIPEIQRDLATIRYLLRITHPPRLHR